MNDDYSNAAIMNKDMPKCSKCHLIHNELRCPWCGSGWKMLRDDEEDYDIIEQSGWYFKQMKAGKDEGELIDFLDSLKLDILL